MKDLPEYSKALPSDTQQFLSIDDAARYQLEGKDSARIWPQQSSQWFAAMSKDVLKLAEQAQKRIGNNQSREFNSTIADMKILANLAMYHSHRANAGVSYALFKHSQDLNAFDDAIAHESRAIEVWGRLVEAAGDIYHSDLIMGRESAGLSGHWSDELVKLKEGLAILKQQRDNFQPAATEMKLTITHVPIRKAQPGKKLIIRTTVNTGESGVKVKIGYRSSRRDYVWKNMKLAGPFIYHAEINGRDVKPGLNYLIEASDGRIGRTRTEPITVVVTKDDEPPRVRHKHISSAEAGNPITVTADVRDAGGIKWVRLLYRSVTQYQDYKTLQMVKTDKKDEYKAVVPGEDVEAKWDFMYLIEVMDENGNGKIYPDLEYETPYVVVKLKR
jgi:hypothetical protein